MSVAALLQEFAQATGLGQVTFNVEGVCRIVFDDELVVDFEPVPGRSGMFVHAVVGVLPAGVEPELLKELLAANLFGVRTGGATLALDRTRGEIMLHRELPAEGLDYPAFSDALEQFVNALERWQSWLISAAAHRSAAEAPIDASSFIIRG